MTVGLPGAGIGGLFYLLSALMMPFHTLWNALMQPEGQRRDKLRGAPWPLITKQFATALGIIFGLWITGLALGALLLSHPAALGQINARTGGTQLPNILRLSIVIAAFITLAAVLTAVQIARLVVASTEKQRIARRTVAKKVAAALLLLMIGARSASAQSSTPAMRDAARHIALADGAFAAEDTAVARREYEAALASNPSATRALFRLGQLAKRNPRKAESYFRQYAAAEPNDAWGWMALGDAYAASKDYSRAIDAYDRAMAIAPDERDAVIGRARVLARAGLTDRSVAAYESWTVGHPSDSEAFRDLAAQRRRAGRFAEARRAYAASIAAAPSAKASAGEALSRSMTAPAADISAGGSGDSDQNKSVRMGGSVSAQVSDRARLQLGGGHRRLSGYADVSVDDASLAMLARPLAAFRLEAAGGVSRPRSVSTVTDTIFTPGTGQGRRRNTPPVGTVIRTQTEQVSNIFVGSLRGVWRQPGGHSSLDLRATRMLLDATPVLVLNRVVRNEIAGRADIGILPRIKLRGGARAGTYNANDDANTRISLLGGVAVAATDAIEVSGVFQRLTFDHATASGYFAPRMAQLGEAATYAEFESMSGIVLALDAGAGVQRLAEFGADIGNWEPSYRLFASLDVPVRAGSSVRFDLDSYDSRLGSDVPTASSSWRFISLSASVRLALR